MVIYCFTYNYKPEKEKPKMKTSSKIAIIISIVVLYFIGGAYLKKVDEVKELQQKIDRAEQLRLEEEEGL